MQDKKKIRTALQQKRDALSQEDVICLSKKITGHLVKSTIYNKSSHICAYQAFRNEVSCEYIINQALADGKHVYLPVTDQTTHTIDFYKITRDTRYRIGAYGIKEPVIDQFSEKLDQQALILMPGLAFDRKKHRLGYGGGYYDKFLANCKEHITAALCYSFQITEELLPYEKHDILPDYIVTEQEIW